MDGEEEGQGPRDKSGIGFHGDPVAVFRRPDARPGAGYSAGYVPDILNTDVGITTAFSSAAQRAGVPERYDRSQHTLYLKFRDPAVKFCRGGVQGGTTQ